MISNLRVQNYLIAAFVVIAFSIYFTSYFAVVSNYTSLIKLVSLSFLFLGFYSKKILVNCYDAIYLFVIMFFTGSYIVAIFEYGIHDLLFINFIVFSAVYVWMTGENSRKKIFFSYQILASLLCLQVWMDVLLIKVFKIESLMAGGSFVGGMGNPSSFAFACNFCLVSLLFFKNNLPGFLKLFIGGSLVLGVLMSNALFMILAMILIFSIAILLSKGLLGKILIFGIAFVIGVGAVVFILSRGGLLAAKIEAVLVNFGMAEDAISSDSVDLRKKIFTQSLDFIENSGTKFLWGQFQNTSYYDVDSQYITYFFSFGLIGFLIFVLLIAIMSVRAFLFQQSSRVFILIALSLFFLTFFNNRILDYFPVGYLFVSLAALISHPEEKRLN